MKVSSLTNNVIRGSVIVSFLSMPFRAANAQALSKGVADVKTFATNQGLFQGSFTDVIGKIILFILSLTAVIAVAVVIWGGFAYLTSLGDEKKVGKAKQIILAAVIGLVIIGLSFTLVQVILGFFK
jgi:hypothetical protein